MNSKPQHNYLVIMAKPKLRLHNNDEKTELWLNTLFNDLYGYSIKGSLALYQSPENKPFLLSSSLYVFPCACLSCCHCASASLCLCLCVSSQSAPYVRWDTEATEVRDQVQEVGTRSRCTDTEDLINRAPTTSNVNFTIFGKCWKCFGWLIRMAMVVTLLPHCSPQVFQPDKKKI